MENNWQQNAKNAIFIRLSRTLRRCREGSENFFLALKSLNIFGKREVLTLWK